MSYAVFSLLQQLKEYGLNPSEWHLRLCTEEQAKQASAQIIHRRDPDLSLSARCEFSDKSGQPLLRWTELRLDGFF